MNAEQLQYLRNTAVETTYDDCLQNPDLLRSIICQWIDRKSPEEQLQSLSSDSSTWTETLGFDPATGRLCNDSNQDAHGVLS